jgi:hypothetical protein
LSWTKDFRLVACMLQALIVVKTPRCTGQTQ